MSRQNSFGDCCRSCQNGYRNSCNNQQSRCDDKDKNPCVVCPPGAEGPQGPRGPIGATGTSQIVGMAVVTTTATNSVLTVRNPAGNAAALTITPLAGGTRLVSAHLVITQIS